jgi:RNA polymerase sigma factor (TIGR02999 family)
MRRVVIDHARAKLRLKRGARNVHSGLDHLENLSDDRSAELVRLDEALASLAAVDPFKAAVVDLHFFGGFTVQETADALGCSTATITRHWRNARAWLLQEMIPCEGSD